MIEDPCFEFFRESERARHPDVQGGCEPNPDIAIYHRGVWGDSRRWSCDGTFNTLLLAAEVIVSERADSRLHPGEIVTDIKKPDPLRQEVQEWESDIVPVMPVVDTVETSEGRMTRSPPEKTGRARRSWTSIIFYYGSCRCIDPDEGPAVRRANRQSHCAH